MSLLLEILAEAHRARRDVKALLDALERDQVLVEDDGTVDPTRLLAALLLGGALLAAQKSVTESEWVAAARRAFSTMNAVVEAERQRKS